MELEVKVGRGFCPGDENKKPDQPIGVIAIDSLFSPVTRVRYAVEAARVGQRTDYDKLTLEIETDGSITPRDALASAMAGIDWNRYPDRGASRLRTAIGELHGVGPEQVFVANGSNEVLQSLLLAYSGAGRTVVTFEPTYQLHSHIARIAGATVVSGRRQDDFTLDPQEVRRVCTQHAPSVTFLCSPNNPTGLADSHEVLQAAIESTPGIVLVDEAYAQFSPLTALEFVREDARVAVSRTYSKTWAMAAATSARSSSLGSSGSSSSTQLRFTA